MVLAIGHTLRAHEALGRPDALPGFLEVVHRLFEDGVFLGHGLSIRAGIFRSPEHCVFSCELSYQRREVAGSVPCNVLRVSWDHLRTEHPVPDRCHTVIRALPACNPRRVEKGKTPN